MFILTVTETFSRNQRPVYAPVFYSTAYYTVKITKADLWF